MRLILQCNLCMFFFLPSGAYTLERLILENKLPAGHATYTPVRLTVCMFGFFLSRGAYAPERPIVQKIRYSALHQVERAESK